MSLSQAQRIQFHRDGYLRIPGAVSRRQVQRALQVINHSLGQEGMNKDDLPTLRSRSYCAESQQHAAITDLFNASSLTELAATLLGEVNPAGSGQIALRFPRSLDLEAPPPNGHLDGIGSGLNGTEKGSFSRGFSALAVVLLSDLPEPNAGNFTVWPGSHHLVERYLQTHGIEVLHRGQPEVELPMAPVQITGEPGDAVIAHHQIIHTAGPNVSPHIRYAVIFRVSRPDTKAFGVGALTDIWHEWPGVQSALAEKET